MTALEKPVTRKARVRKPQHGVSDELVITLYPGGQIGIRELRRPADTEKQFDAAQLYAAAVTRDVAAAQRARRRMR